MVGVCERTKQFILLKLHISYCDFSTFQRILHQQGFCENVANFPLQYSYMINLKLRCVSAHHYIIFMADILFILHKILFM